MKIFKRLVRINVELYVRFGDFKYVHIFKFKIYLKSLFKFFPLIVDIV